MLLDHHPTVRRVRGTGTPQRAADATPRRLDATALRQACLDAGADDVGFVALDHPDLAEEREHALAALPGTRSLVAFVCRMNRDDVRSPVRSVANQEFHAAGDHVNEVARRIARHLEDAGVRAVNPAMAFPQEIHRFPGRMWVVSHKRVAAAAGLGHMGLHRNLIHPRFGSFVLLGTVLTDAEVSAQGAPLDYNPCLDCKLCVAACPVGAIGVDGSFDLLSCYTHNYREFMGGFTGWVHAIAESTDAEDYRRRVSDAETLSMWQSLAYKPGYKAAYCLAVCPAGEDVIGPFLADRPRHLADVVRPLQHKEEPVYVLPGSRAEAHVAQRFPHKHARHVGAPPPPRASATEDAPADGHTA